MARLDMFTKQAEIAARGGLRFLFAPQLNIGINPFKGIFAAFVQLVAQTLATARLLPETHRAVRPLTLADARLGEVLALAYANVRKPGSRPDQIAVFGAITLLMALSVMVLVSMSLSVLIGTAHAFSIVINVTTCALGGGGTSLFVAPCTSDMAQQWIEMIFFMGSNDFGGNAWSAKVMSLPLREGLYAMFQTYSTAMLVVAGFLVLYHILAIVAGTAHEGRTGGRAMNQIWAPIRLVMAIGLLVPIGYNGFNSGQMIVLYAAKWGSGLASNIWANFATAFAWNTGAFVLAPPLPQVSPMLQNALKVLTCAAGYNETGTKVSSGFHVQANGWYTLGPNIYKSWDWINGSGSDKEPATCGSVEMPNPDYSAGGDQYAFLGTATVLTTSQQLRRNLLEAHRDALDAEVAIGSASAPTCTTGGTSSGGSVSGTSLWQLANKLYWSANAGETCYRLTQSDLELFNTAVTDYRSALQSSVGAALSSASLDATSMAQDAYVRGWLSAGIWFNTIARVNGLVIDFTQEIPVVRPDFKMLMEPQYAAPVLVAMESADASIAALPSLSSGSGITAETGFILSFGGGAGGDSVLDMYLKTMAANIAFVLGQGAGSTNEVTGGGANAPIFRLNTANPLAELSALGYRIIDLAMKTSRAVNDCMAAVNNEAQQVKNGRNPNEYGVLTGCGGASYVGTVPTETFMMQAAIGSMISGGITLAFMLPLIPFIRFMFGILTWVLSLFETVIAIPVVALAHIKMDGDGLSGPLARTGYLLLLQLFLRPTLMIFGLIVALLLFNIMALALNEFYTMAVRGVENSGRLGAISAVIYTVIYAAMAYALANASFKAIDLVPNQALQWIGGPNGQTIDESQRISNAVGETARLGHVLGSRGTSGSTPLSAGAITTGSKGGV